MSLAADLWHILTPRQRRGVGAMQAVSLLIALSTAGGIASIAPFFAVLGQPALIEQNAWLHRLYLAGGFSSRQSFTLALGAGAGQEFRCGLRHPGNFCAESYLSHRPSGRRFCR